MKLGLALSGGGFRASFFHIGVLANLAEIGKLKQIEVISTVSGGSIVGAMYYVKLKKLLDSNPSPTDEQLVSLVQELEIDFLAGVQKNIRMRAFINPLKNLRMSWANYSRSDRLAELYDELFYRPVLNPDSNQMVKMRDLKIAPNGKKVKPDEYNQTIASGKCKLPIILINSTSLNSGHNWRFEASRMGEPEHTSQEMFVIDKNSRFSRPEKYADMPEVPGNIRLGHAVAASACVPGLFNPLAISDLYKDIRIQLVDGGVHDNQGLEALMDKSCDEIIISDASGQMGDELEPSAHIPQVVGRSNSILMDRVREEELKEALSHHKIKKTTLLHLRKGLTTKKIPYINETNPGTPNDDDSQKFGVHPDIQDALSNIRTDLDSFSDIEADALMADGYLMCRQSFDGIETIAKGEWRFSYLLGKLADTSRPLLIKHLNIASKQFLKGFFTKPVISTLMAVLVAATISLMIWLLLGQRIEESLNVKLDIKTYKELFIYIGSFLFMTVLSIMLSRWKKIHVLYKAIKQPLTFIGRFFVRALPPTIGSSLIWLHLAVFDQIFLKAGDRKHFKN